MRRLGTHWAPVAIWAALLLVLGTRPAGQLPSAPWPGFDKVAHALAYGVLGFAFVRARGTRGGLRALLLGALAGAAVGALDEWSQGFVAGRTSSAFDLLADLLGAAAGGWLAYRTIWAHERS